MLNLAPPSLNLKDYLGVFSGALEPEFCDQLVQEYEASRYWQTASVGQGTKDTRTRSCDTLALNNPKMIADDPKVRSGVVRNLDRATYSVLQMYREKFPNLHDAQLAPYELLRYQPGGFYNEHVDHNHFSPRALSILYLLNDEFEGGGLSFFGKQVVLRMKKGDCVLFPSNFMFPHAVLPVTSGVRYSIVSWLK